MYMWNTYVYLKREIELINSRFASSVCSFDETVTATIII